MSLIIEPGTKFSLLTSKENYISNTLNYDGVSSEINVTLNADPWQVHTTGTNISKLIQSSSRGLLYINNGYLYQTDLTTNTQLTSTTNLPNNWVYNNYTDKILGYYTSYGSKTYPTVNIMITNASDFSTYTTTNVGSLATEIDQYSSTGFSGEILLDAGTTYMIGSGDSYSTTSSSYYPKNGYSYILTSTNGTSWSRKVLYTYTGSGSTVQYGRFNNSGGANNQYYFGDLRLLSASDSWGSIYSINGGSTWTKTTDTALYNVKYAQSKYIARTGNKIYYGSSILELLNKTHSTTILVSSILNFHYYNSYYYIGCVIDSKYYKIYKTNNFSTFEEYDVPIGTNNIAFINSYAVASKSDTLYKCLLSNLYVR